MAKKKKIKVNINESLCELEAQLAQLFQCATLDAKVMGLEC